MNVYVGQSSFWSSDILELIKAIVYRYADFLLARGVHISELNTKVVDICYSCYFLTTVWGSGLPKFFRNCYHEDIEPDDVYLSLGNIHAIKMQELFHQAMTPLFEESQDYDLFKEYAIGKWYYEEDKYDKDHPEMQLIYKVHEKLSNDFRELLKEENLHELIYEHIKTIENLQIVPDDQVEPLMIQLLHSIPDLEERQEARKMELAFQEQLDAIFQKFNQKFLHLCTMEIHKVNQVKHFIIDCETDKGYFCLKTHGTQAALFEKDGVTLVGECTIDTPLS